MGAIDQFGFECRLKALHRRVVVAAAHVRETGEHVMRLQQGLILVAGVLAALVGVMEEFVQ